MGDRLRAAVRGMLAGHRDRLQRQVVLAQRQVALRLDQPGGRASPVDPERLVHQRERGVDALRLQRALRPFQQPLQLEAGLLGPQLAQPLVEVTLVVVEPQTVGAGQVAAGPVRDEAAGPADVHRHVDAGGTGLPQRGAGGRVVGPVVVQPAGGRHVTSTRRARRPGRWPRRRAPPRSR